LARLEEALADNSASLEIRARLAKQYAAVGRYADARRLVEDLLATQPTDPAFRRWLLAMRQALTP
jgi:thioredoxin-like negative regulator of GroEL